MKIPYLYDLCLKLRENEQQIATIHINQMFDFNKYSGMNNLI